MIDSEGVKSRIKAFDDSHGNFVYVDGWLLFEDGAQRENNPLGALIGPPPDPLKLAKKIRWYWKVKLELAVEEFHHYRDQHLLHARTACKQQFVSAPLKPTEEVVEHLKELQKKVRACQGQLKAAEKVVEQHKPQRLRELEEQSERFRNEADTLIAEIENIEI